MINPLQDLLGQSPWWLMALVLLCRVVRARRVEAGRDDPGLRGRHPLDRPVERHDGHARDDAGRDGAGDADRGRARGVDGPQPAGRPRDPAVPGRLPGAAALRLPGPGARAVRGRPVHRDHGRRRLRRPDRDQARGRRHPWCRTHHRRGGPVHREHRLADDHQGPAADVPRGAGARRQPGPAVRAGDGRHRRHGRAPAASATSWSPASARTSCSARGSPRASPSPRSGS